MVRPMAVGNERRTMKKILLATAVIVLVLVAGALYVMMSGPDLSAYEKYREPALISMSTQKVLVVEATGAPAQAAERAMPFLFKIYYSLADAPRGHSMPAPRARWPMQIHVPQEQWIGRFALPIPESVTALPTVSNPGGPQPKIDRWEYGEVAQILHIGPYDKETPTIEKLTQFIKDHGYAITGEHEEEYLRGPTMFGKGNPDRYYTLIRYPVKKTVN
jgi:hypothetical protein